MNPILKLSFSKYVKTRFAELLKQGVDGEKAYTIAAGEYIKAALDQSKKNAKS